MIEKELLRAVQSAGGHVWLEGSQLHYKVPKVGAASLVHLIKDNKASLVSALRSGETEDQRTARKILNIESVSDSDSFLPLRVERMWRTEFEKNGSAPFIPFDINFSVLLEPGTNIDWYIESIYRAIKKHQSLRTRLAIEGGHPVQVIRGGTADIEVAVVSIRGSLRSNWSAVKEAAAAFLNPPIKLLSENGFRARIFRDDEGNLIFAAVLHHFVCDYWSTRILMKEIQTNYELLSRGGYVRVDGQPLQYTEYTRMQRRAVLENLGGYLDYWNGALRDIEPSRLPYDHVTNTDLMEPLFYVIKPELVNDLRRKALSLGTSLFVVLLAGYQLLLSRWTKNEDVLNAISVADRVDSSYATVIGYLITALPIGSKIRAADSVSDYIKTLSVKLEAGYPFKELSYELYQDIYDIPQPYCTTLFNYIPINRLLPQGDSIDPSEYQDQVLFFSGPRFQRQMHHREIYFELVELLVGLRGRIYFNTDYFQRSTMEALIQKYISILEQVAVSGSATRCGEIA